MEKIDRLGWVVGFSIDGFGARIGFRTNSPEALDEIRARLPFGVKEAPFEKVDSLYSLLVGGAGRGGAKRFSLLYNGLQPVARSLDVDQVLDALAPNLRVTVAEHARRVVFVHAGVVAWGNHAILIPGRTFTGKTTLVKAFVEAGATYYSDEYALLTPAGRVLPFAQPLSIRGASGSGVTHVPVESLGGVAGTRGIPVATVLVTHYREGARFSPRSISPGQALLALFENTVPARRRPQAVLSTLRNVMATAMALKGVRGEAKDVVVDRRMS